MKLQNLKQYIVFGVTMLMIGYLCFLIGQWSNHNKGVILQPSSEIATAETHTFTMQTPNCEQIGLDKSALKKEGYISKQAEQSKSIEVTAAAQTKDETGTKNLTAQTNTQDGKTVIVQERPTMEFMSANALGFAIEVNPRGLDKEIYYRRTFGRAWNSFGWVEPGLRFHSDSYVFKNVDGKELFLKAGVEYRF